MEWGMDPSTVYHDAAAAAAESTPQIQVISRLEVVRLVVVPPLLASGVCGRRARAAIISKRR